MMDIGSILLILALLVLVAWYISRPLFERKSTSFSREEHELSTLLAERDRVIQSLQEIDFDYKLGKIPEEDYPTQRNLLLQRGAEVLRQLDALQPQQTAGTAADRLERAIAARRLQQREAAATPQAVLDSPAVPPLKNGNRLAVPDDDLEQQISDRRRSRKEKTGGFCPKCGRPIQISDKFCPKCGAKVSALKR
jgi:hypothetical protein